MAAANTPPNEEDDLFDFDKLDPGTKSRPATATPAAATTPRSAPAAPAAASAAPSPAASTVPPAPVAGEPRAQPAHPPAVAAAATPVPRPALEGAAPGTILVHERKQEPWRPARERPAPSSAVRAAAMFTGGALALATFVNLSLAGVVWKSMTGLDRALAGGALAVHRSGARVEPVQASGASLAPPVPDEGELALTAASEEIRRGEFESARARIYSLLAVIDRFDGPARARLASRAQVLAADAFREQADALDRVRLQRADEPGFVDPAAEERR